MANSPIQIVLNSGDFVGDWLRQANGSQKDFYFDKDSEFAVHKNKISSQLISIKETQIHNKYSKISFAKVSVRQDAIAKTHRPTTSLFKRSLTPIVGGGELGEIFVELKPSAIDIISGKIDSAELDSRVKEDKITGKNKPNPSPIRSELGAIENIVAYEASDKRNFSIKEGVAWISQPQTGGIYIVELFQIPPLKKDWDSLDTDHFNLFNSLDLGLREIGTGLVVSRIFDSPKNTPMLSIKIEDTLTPPSIQYISTSSFIKQSSQNPINLDENKNALLINFLDSHPLVRKIILPPIIHRTENENENSSKNKYSIPSKIKNKKYPKIGIVDGGVSNILGDWIIGRLDVLHALDKDESHGTFIAGLLLSGNTLNGSEICKEDDGCQIIDVAILPRESSMIKNYYIDIVGFFTYLEESVIDLKSKYGVRIFNFSLNVEEHGSSNGYSFPARCLDKIAEENDVIFVIAAGNTKNSRQEWPSDSIEALKILAGSRNDTIKSPSESYRNISVSALNPPNLEKVLAFGLSNYSCRGPKMRIGLKPDFAHFGGSGTKDGKLGHGLFSIDIKGETVDGCGTSYAAPNVAKTIACLENAIEGDVSRETLIALSVHHAVLPKIFSNKNLKNITKDLIGFGVPSSCADVLNGNEHSITLVFANRIYQGKRMSFNFSWPACLVDDGNCSGLARLTLVSTPPFDYKFGEEFMRVNIEAHLRQLQDDEEGSYKGQLKAIYLTDTNKFESSKIKNSFKWSPVKVSEKRFLGIGKKSEWKLEVEYLAREGEILPTVGIPFTAILTISDPKKQQPVFSEMRQTLQAMGLKIFDIQIAARNAVRI